MQVSERLQLLAKQLGVSQAKLAQLLDTHRSVLNPYFTGARPAGLPMLRRWSTASGRTVAWLMGEDVGRSVIGTLDATGRVAMDSKRITIGIIAVPSATRDFPAGTQLLVDPASAFVPGAWLLVRVRGGDDDWIAWASDDGRGTLDRANGELHSYDPERYEITGMIVGQIVPPPKRPSARWRRFRLTLSAV